VSGSGAAGSDGRTKHERGPTVLAWQDLHDPDADGYHESLGALRPRSRRD
jgi:hypothetical protein